MAGRPTAGTRRRLFARPLFAWALAVVAFLATRLARLDADPPPWELAMYQPIDEFEYVLPALNLHHYGTWAHQETIYSPIEGAPMNILQSLATALTLEADWSYWGFRLPSVLFGLVAFLAMLLVVRALVRRAEADQVVMPVPVAWLLPIATLVLLADFSFLVSGRIVEPTVVRAAYVAIIIWLAARGTFLSPAHTVRRSLVLGMLGGAGVLFVYIYNAFLVPGLLLATVAWQADRPRREMLRHVAALGLGVAVSAAVYFALVFVVYGHGIRDWYDMWVALYRDTGRADVLDVSQIWTLLEANIFRLDRPFMLLTLLVLPAFLWWVVKRRDGIGIVVASLGLAFVAQSALQSDYPPRKLLVLLPIAIPVAVGGLVRLGDWLVWVRERRARLLVAWAWGIVVVAGTIVVTVPPEWVRWATLRRLLDLPAASQVSYRVGLDGAALSIGALVGTAAVVALVLAWRRRMAAQVAGLLLVTAMLGPLLLLDARHVVAGPTTGYRDAMISIRPIVDGKVTAGAWSFAMQLYNTSRPVLQGYLFGTTLEEYEQALVRYVTEHDTAATFAYADEEAQDWLRRLGFVLEETYAIPLPKDRVMGRYRYDPASATP